MSNEQQRDPYNLNSKWFNHTGRVRLRDQHRLNEILLSVGLGQCEHFYSVLLYILKISTYQNTIGYKAV